MATYTLNIGLKPNTSPDAQPIRASYALALALTVLDNPQWVRLWRLESSGLRQSRTEPTLVLRLEVLDQYTDKVINGSTDGPLCYS